MTKTCMNKGMKTHFLKCKLIFLSLDAYSAPHPQDLLHFLLRSPLSSAQSDQIGG